MLMHSYSTSSVKMYPRVMRAAEIGFRVEHPIVTQHWYHVTTGRCPRWHSCLFVSVVVVTLQILSTTATSTDSRRDVVNYPGPVSSPKAPTEYCEFEPFQPRCSADEVIRIVEARYGLLFLGRCLASDFGYVGCFADVIDYVGGQCSGRRFCRQDVPDKRLSAASTRCPVEFKSFLHASYDCIPVGNASSCRSCHSGGVVRLNAAGSDGTGGYIASVVAAERQDDNGCGGPRCPWVIEAQPGQVINLTLYEFSSQHSGEAVPSHGSPGGGSRSRGSSGSDPCPGSRYAIIKERANPRDFSVCGGGSGSPVSGRHVFTSVSNVVELQVVSAEALSWKLQFVIRYEAVGCADVSPPTNGWSRRIEGRMELGCTSTTRQWTLKCVGNKWTGDLEATCISSVSSSVSSSVNFDQIVEKLSAWYQEIADYVSSVPLGILITTVSSILLVLLVIIITCCFVCIKRRRYRTRYHPPTNQRPEAVGRETDQCGGPPDGYGPNMFYPPSMTCKLHNPEWMKAMSADQSANNDTNKYVCGGQGEMNSRPVMDTRPLPSLPRRPGNDDGAVGSYVAGSLRSNASGSDASLHWGDTPPRPDVMVAPPRGHRDDDASFNGQMVPGLHQQRQQSSWPHHDPRLSRHGSVAVPEDDYLTPRTMSSTATSSEFRNPDGSPVSVMHKSPPPVMAADQNGARPWPIQQQQQQPHPQQMQQFWRQHPQLMARASFPVVMGNEDRQASWDVADPSHQTMPRSMQSTAGATGVSAGHPGGRLP